MYAQEAMSKVTEIQDIKVPIFQVEFLTEESAFWLAVECLFVSEAKSVNFHYLYMNRIVDKLIQHNKNATQFLTMKELREAFELVVAFADTVVDAKLKMDDLLRFVSEEFVPLGLASNMICKGASKSNAFLETAEIYRDLRLKNSGDDIISNIRPSKYADSRTLQRRWSQYATIMPYIHTYVVKMNFETAGAKPLDHRTLINIVPEYLNMLRKSKRTKPIRLGTVKRLVFLPSNNFSEFVPS